MYVLVDDLVPVGLDLVGLDIVKFFSEMPFPMSPRITTHQQQHSRTWTCMFNSRSVQVPTRIVVLELGKWV